MSRNKSKNKVRTILNILIYIFLIFCLFSVIFVTFSKKDSDGAADIFGYQMRIVTSDSMGKCELTDVSSYEIGSIPVRSMIFIKTVPKDLGMADEWYRTLKVGDVLTFRYVYTTQVTITHRITSITEKNDGGFVIKLAGDNINSEGGQLYQTIDTSIKNNTSYVIGKVEGKSYILGFLLSFLTTPAGMVLIIIVPSFIIMLLEILKVTKAITADKKKREKEKNEKLESEIMKLRLKLSEYENQNVNDSKDRTE